MFYGIRFGYHGAAFIILGLRIVLLGIHTIVHYIMVQMIVEIKRVNASQVVVDVNDAKLFWVVPLGLVRLPESFNALTRVFIFSSPRVLNPLKSVIAVSLTP